MDITLFDDHLKNKAIDEAKKIASASPRACGELWHFCLCGSENQTMLAALVKRSGLDLQAHAQRGAPLNKPAIVRKLLDLGMDVNYTTSMGLSPLFVALCHKQVPVARILLDAGGTCGMYDMGRRSYIDDFFWYRLSTRNAAVAILCLQRCGARVLGNHNGPDILRMIARCVWSMRGYQS